MIEGLSEGPGSMRILVVIASYGTQNDIHLERMLKELRAMPYSVDIIVLSNVHKDLGADIQVKVGLPTSNPWSLPFGHRRIFADELNNYDVFLYSEDDMLLTRNHVDAFLEYSSILPEHQVPGFLRIEHGVSGQIQYCDFQFGFGWDLQSVQRHSSQIFAFFYNEHAACYALTREQLARAIQSGYFLVGPHEGRYDMLCSAATDPYTQCGLKKMICISEIERISVHHLSNKYAEKLGLSKPDLLEQVRVLVDIAEHGPIYAPLVQLEHKLDGGRYSRDHYEAEREDILSLVPKETKSVLSFGGGETEISLAKSGMRVVTIPADPVASARAARQGVEIILGDWASIDQQLQGEQFDCLLLHNVLHVGREPKASLSLLMQFLRNDGVILVSSPVISGLAFWNGWLRRGEGPKAYREAGINRLSPSLLTNWLRQNGGKIILSRYVPPREGKLAKLSRWKILQPVAAKEFLLFAKKGAI